MEFSRQFLINISQDTSFIKDNLEKVIRLAEILKILNSDSVFKGKLALKGGTAINLTAVELPRLSVDIDLDYTENVSREELLEVKEHLSNRLTDYMWQEGYSLSDTRDYFALSSYLFNYTNAAGNRDNIKIEINYLDRLHILPLENKPLLTKGIIDHFDVLTLNVTELYASKINALLSRATPRDLYDVNSMLENGIELDKDLLRKCLVFYNVIGGDYDLENLSYDNVKRLDFKKYKTQLKPVIAKNDKFDIEKAKEKVIAFLRDMIVLTQEEQEFIKLFNEKDYRPDLLFGAGDIANNLINHPAAHWRCMDKNETLDFTLEI